MSENQLFHDFVEDNEPSNEILNIYRSKLEKCRRDFEKVTQALDRLVSFQLQLESLKSFSFLFSSINCQLKEKLPQELLIEKAEEKIHNLTDVLSRTQALLLVERNNSQKMALHIDFLLVC